MGKVAIIFFASMAACGITSQERGLQVHEKKIVSHEITDFHQIITTMKTMYIDKTLFVKDALEDPFKIMIISRPARFGKTLMMSTLDYFLNHRHLKHQSIFNGLHIMADTTALRLFRDNFMHKHIVIFLTFDTMKCTSFKEAYAEFLNIIRKVIKDNVYILEGSKESDNCRNKRFKELLSANISQNEAQDSIKLLSKHLTEYHKDDEIQKQIIVLIDGYDVPLHSAYIHGYYSEMESIMKGFLQATLISNRYVHKCVITGLTNTGKESIFSHKDTFKVDTIFEEPFDEYFGFTHEDVKDLIGRTRNSDKNNTFTHLNKMFGGYTFGRIEMLNPWSVNRYLIFKNGDLGVASLSTQILQKLLAENGLYPIVMIQRLIEGERLSAISSSETFIFSNLKKSLFADWSYLSQLGYFDAHIYLVYVGVLNLTIRVPNAEVKSELVATLGKVSDSTSLKIPNYRDMITKLVNGDVLTAKESMKIYLTNAGQYLQVHGKDGKERFTESFCKYAIDILKGVGFQQHTDLKIDRWPENITVEFESKHRGISVRITLKRISKLRSSWNKVKRRFCRNINKNDGKLIEMIIYFDRSFVDICTE